MVYVCVCALVSLYLCGGWGRCQGSSITLHLTFSSFIHFSNCVYMSVWGYVPGSEVALRGQRHEIPIELQFQAAVSHLLWVPGVEFRSSGRSLLTLNHWAISSTSVLFFERHSLALELMFDWLAMSWGDLPILSPGATDPHSTGTSVMCRWDLSQAFMLAQHVLEQSSHPFILWVIFWLLNCHLTDNRFENILSHSVDYLSFLFLPISLPSFLS